MAKKLFPFEFPSFLDKQSLQKLTVWYKNFEILTSQSFYFLVISGVEFLKSPEWLHMT